MWIISKIRNDNSSKMLLANFTYLSIIEIIGLLLPLITFPYLIRTIGAQKYGIIVFAQTIVAYLVMIVNFGFNVSATRRISENRHNINKINEIVNSTSKCKFTTSKRKTSQMVLRNPIFFLVCY